MMTNDDERGEGGKKCPKFDDVICERPRGKFSLLEGKFWRLSGKFWLLRVKFSLLRGKF